MSDTQLWSQRDGVYVYFSNVYGIKVKYSPAVDPDGDSDFVFDWTIEFTMNDDYSVNVGYYCDEEQAKQDALIYMKDCWGGEK